MHLGEQKYASGVMRITSFENRDQSQPLRHIFSTNHPGKKLILVMMIIVMMTTKTRRGCQSGEDDGVGGRF